VLIEKRKKVSYKRREVVHNEQRRDRCDAAGDRQIFESVLLSTNTYVDSFYSIQP